MKYLALFALMSGCSLIKIQEAPQPEKHRSQIITVMEYTCGGDSKECQADSTVRISRDKIIFYTEFSKTCYVQLAGYQTLHVLKMTCSEFDQLLNQ
jgi:hypothetical protein